MIKATNTTLVTSCAQFDLKHRLILDHKNSARFVDGDVAMMLVQVEMKLLIANSLKAEVGMNWEGLRRRASEIAHVVTASASVSSEIKPRSINVVASLAERKARKCVQSATGTPNTANMTPQSRLIIARQMPGRIPMQNALM